MKVYFKSVAIYILGLAMGCGITGYVMNRFHKEHLAWLSTADVAVDAMLVRSLREGDAKIVLESTEKRLVTGILEIDKNSELKQKDIAQLSLTAAKRYYVCTKTEYPKEIASIMDSLEPVNESQCNVQ